MSASTLERFRTKQLTLAEGTRGQSSMQGEARTPLIIAGPSEASTDKYYKLDRIPSRLELGEEHKDGDTKYTTGDFLLDEKAQTVTLTEDGVERVEKLQRELTDRQKGTPPGPGDGS